MIVKYVVENLNGNVDWGYREGKDIKIEKVYLDTYPCEKGDDRFSNMVSITLNAYKEQMIHASCSEGYCHREKDPLKIIFVDERCIITNNVAYIMNDKGQTIEKI